MEALTLALWLLFILVMVCILAGAAFFILTARSIHKNRKDYFAWAKSW